MKGESIPPKFLVLFLIVVVMTLVVMIVMAEGINSQADNVPKLMTNSLPLTLWISHKYR